MTTLEERRTYMKLYMREWRLGRHRVRRVRRQPVAPFLNRPGQCAYCGHRWPPGGRCPLCALEAVPVRRAMRRFRVRRWIAWAQLMEALSA